MNTYYVYILASKTATLYIGVTNDLERRVWEHKTKINEGFTKKYNVNRLVYFEETDDINVAIEREKQLKKYRRQKKVEIVSRHNPDWEDLSASWYEPEDIPS